MMKFGWILAVALTAVPGLAAPKNVTLTVYPYPAVARAEASLYVPEGVTAPTEAELVITAPDGSVAKHSVVVEKDQPFFRWTPAMTGYYKMELNGKTISAEREVPALWRTMYFYGWDVPRTPRELAQYPLLGAFGIVTGSNTDCREYRKYGIVPLMNVSFHTSQVKLDLPDEKNIEAVVSRCRKALDSGADGIWLDEVGSYPNPAGLRAQIILGKAWKELRKLYPDKIIMVANAGTPLREHVAACRDAGVVLGAETYPDCVNGVFATHSFEKHMDVRIELFRATDMLFDRGSDPALNPRKFHTGCGIILLGLNNCYGVLEEPVTDRLEYYIRYLKKHAPEMGGLGFWSSRGDTAYTQKHIPYALQNELLERYFVRPVLDMRGVLCSDYNPRHGKPLRVTCEVVNCGGMALYKPFTVRAWAISADGTRTAIGSVTRPDMAVGIVKVDYSQVSQTQVAEYKAGGNTYNVINYEALGGRRKNGTKVLNVARQTVSFDFTPEKPGNYRLVFELEAPEEATVLDGMCEKNLYVR